MDPVAFEIGPLAIRWYGIFVALGFLAGLLYVQHRAAKAGFGGERASNLVFLGLIGGLVGARLFYVALNWEHFRAVPLEILRLDHGGLVYYGGLVGGTLTLVAACLIRGIPMGQLGDLLIPGLPLGHALGRIGCFLNGCCFGVVADNACCTVQYDPGSQAAAVHAHRGLIESVTQSPLPVLPVQLLAAVCNVGIFVFLLWIERRLRFRGQLLAVYLMAYGVYRFLLEFLRGDYLEVGMFTPAQEVSLVMIPAGIILFVVARRRAKIQQGA
ncbi:MAG: prolipoprotein diacylglyceryl transferase [Verrucomicrobiota bacterium]